MSDHLVVTPRAVEERLQIATLSQRAVVGKSYFLTVARHGGVVAAEYAGETFEPHGTPGGYVGCGGAERHLHNFIERVVDDVVAEHAVALLEGIAVAHERVEIQWLGL